LAVQEFYGSAYTGPGVEQQCRHLAVVRECNARRVTAVALERLARRRRGTPHTEEGNAHA
jgi:hypothetical protein